MFGFFSLGSKHATGTVVLDQHISFHCTLTEAHDESGALLQSWSA